MEWFFVAKIKVSLFFLRLLRMEELYQQLKTASDEFVQADKDYDAAVARAKEKTDLRQQAERDEAEAAAVAGDLSNEKTTKRAALEMILDQI